MRKNIKLTASVMTFVAFVLLGLGFAFADNQKLVLTIAALSSAMFYAALIVEYRERKRFERKLNEDKI